MSRTKTNTGFTGTATPERTCDAPGCDEPGEFRAPRSPHALSDYFWFCLEHVREYNQAWNFCQNMDEHDIDDMVRADMTWQRPTWRFGTGPRDRMNGSFRVRENLGGEHMFREDPAHARASRRTQSHGQRGRSFPPGTAEARACATLGLEAVETAQELRQHYLELVKRFHPDANGGCKRAEEKLKSVTEAYMTLRRVLAVNAAH